MWILKARIEAEDGFPKKARAAWQQALFLAPDSLQVLFELGKAEYTASRFNEANSHLKRFVELVGADENRASALKVELNVARRIIERCQETIR